MGYAELNRKLLLWVRWVLGVQYLLGGLNWWYKIFPFPSMTDPVSAAAKHPVLVEMISTGWMFQSAKVIELLTGLVLLSNRFVPLALVVSFPVALTTFGLDANVGPKLSGYLAGTVEWPVLRAKIYDTIFFGGCVLAMQGYLMIAYIEHYLPMFVFKTEPKAP